MTNGPEEKGAFRDIQAYSPAADYIGEYMARIRKVLGSSTYTNAGPEEERLKRALMQREQIRSVQPVSSGDMALYCALLALRERDEESMQGIQNMEDDVADKAKLCLYQGRNPPEGNPPERNPPERIPPGSDPLAQDPSGHGPLGTESFEALPLRDGLLGAASSRSDLSVPDPFMGFPVGEVITTPFSFVSTAEAVIRAGYLPVFCDIDPVTCTIDPKKIPELINERTRAILPVHVFGNICDIDAIRKIGEKYHIPVIYDAAHAFGEKYRGVSIMKYGDISCTSFHTTKAAMHTIEGGAVFTDDKEMGERIRLLQNFGIRDAEHTDCIGCNGKMNELEAAVGLVNLSHYEDERKKRALVHDRYRRNLSGIPGIRLPIRQEGVETNFAYFPVLIEDAFGISRDELVCEMNRNGIYPRKYFYPLISRIPAVEQVIERMGRIEKIRRTERMGRIKSATPIAEDVSKRILCLPFYSALEAADIDRVCGVIKRAYADHYEGYGYRCGSRKKRAGSA